jgi:indole-3-glycerol phosphate synthase
LAAAGLEEPSVSLTASIRRRQAEGRLPVLSEIKVRSPKEGDLLRGRDPVALAKTMSSRPVAGISVVTEPQDFGGSLALLLEVTAAVDAPVLRKDFVRDLRGLEETVSTGAAGILLTVGVIERDLLVELHAAGRALGLETLVEVHDAGELDWVRSQGLEPDLLGINNRDILVGETDDGDVSLTEGLVSLVPDGWLVLSESAISGPDDARRAREAGADAVLVGTWILQAPDPATAIDALAAVGWPA